MGPLAAHRNYSNAVQSPTIAGLNVSASRNYADHVRNTVARIVFASIQSVVPNHAFVGPREFVAVQNLAAAINRPMAKSRLG